MVETHFWHVLPADRFSGAIFRRQVKNGMPLVQMLSMAAAEKPRDLHRHAGNADTYTSLKSR